MKLLSNILMVACLTFVLAPELMAQPLPPSSTPIDGGLVSLLLLGGGGALAAKKIRERQRKKNNPGSDL